MKLPKSAHSSHLWRIHELTSDFRRLVVYPALLRRIESGWRARADGSATVAD
jgi:hypothetical protein